MFEVTSVRKRVTIYDLNQFKIILLLGAWGIVYAVYILKSILLHSFTLRKLLFPKNSFKMLLAAIPTDFLQWYLYFS